MYEVYIKIQTSNIINSQQLVAFSAVQQILLCVLLWSSVIAFFQYTIVAVALTRFAYSKRISGIIVPTLNWDEWTKQRGRDGYRCHGSQLGPCKYHYWLLLWALRLFFYNIFIFSFSSPSSALRQYFMFMQYLRFAPYRHQNCWLQSLRWSIMNFLAQNNSIVMSIFSYLLCGREIS